MPLPLTVSCFSKIQIGLPFWYRLTRVVPDKGPLNGCVSVCVRAYQTGKALLVFILILILVIKPVILLILLSYPMSEMSKRNCHCTLIIGIISGCNNCKKVDLRVLFAGEPDCRWLARGGKDHWPVFLRSRCVNGSRWQSYWLSTEISAAVWRCSRGNDWTPLYWRLSFVLFIKT